MRRVKSPSSTAAFSQQVRRIRSIIPPRPAVTTIAYLNNVGSPVRSLAESDLSLIRTRDNKFYLQRVLPGGEVVRWLAPGLERLKGVTNFDTYSLNEIDEYGGIIVPADVVPSSSFEPMGFRDAVIFINRITAVQKFTRKDRRQWHRRLFSHWKENPDKLLNRYLGTYGIGFFIVCWAVMRCVYAVKNNRSFWDVDVYATEAESAQRVTPWQKMKAFSDKHPEHEGMDITVTMLSPGQSRLSSTRAELRESDFTDPHYHSELWWKIRHLRYYGHWPKGLAE